MLIRKTILIALTPLALTVSVSAFAGEQYALGLSGDSVEDASLSENRAQGLIDHGMEYLGIRYKYGGTSPETGLDCSGLVQNVFRKAVGLHLPRRASDMARLGTKVGKADLRPGDLVFFNTARRAYSHVGLYIGDGQFLHAPSSGGKVRVESINARYWVARFNGGRRLLESAG